ncbi:ABC transporter permease [Kallotenue papyrolyticum]|uniref:ABC transporter permease n=1 Tax=Kallotenue papyrolyticum TaxID=1325125 RepID=UPI0004B7306D|nr:ABC transporter permease [Kallotenue papyrolyticum]
MAQTQTFDQPLAGAVPRTQRRLSRARIVGGVGVLVALLLILVVTRDVAWDQLSRLDIARPGAAPGTPPLLRLPLPTVATVVVLQSLLAVAGLYIALRQPPGWITTYVSTLIAMAFFTILLWAVAGSSVDVVDVLARVVRLATPITLGALAGIVCERSGVVNIGIEGTMLFAACLGYIAAILSGSTWLGVLAAMLTACLVSALHALLSVTFKVDQIISGTVLNLLAVGTTGYLRGGFIISYQQQHGAQITAQQLPALPIPLLSQIPVLGPILFAHQPITYLMLLLVPALHVLLFRTIWGLRTRAVGENPKAADTVGINVNRLRFRNVVLSGLLSGLAGAWFALEASFRFDDVMTNGRGFIALAAMIFGKWTPLGAFGGALLFSGADALQIKIQSYDFDLPRQFLQALPYLVTLVVLAGIIGRARPPAAVGKPYEKA